MNNKKVLVWISWWVDSAVTAHLLLKQWYEVIAWFMKNYADESNPNCHTREDRNMAIKVAQSLWIKTFVIFDFREEYNKTIIDYIYNWYKQWYTPNPDVLCNTEVKFKLFLDAALSLWCEYVATWHYARISKDDTWYHLLKWVDTNKDQSYFLSWLNQKQLSHALFPLWALTKPEVRLIAEEINLPNAKRKDSQWLCFIWKIPMKEFLKQTLPVTEWNIITTDGTILGSHEWAWFYTIGQRQWLWLAWWPWFVIRKDVTKNEIVVWREDEQLLFASTLIAANIHRVNPVTLPVTCQAKIRYRQVDQECTVIQWEEQWTIKVSFTEKQRAISSWQTVAFYQWDELLGSWIIAHALYDEEK